MKKKYPRIQLNEQQKNVVNWNNGAVIVSAGPGSGKSASIVERIARMLSDGVKPNSILATTFTRKAADVMNDRLYAMGVDTSRMSIQTMHAFCWRVLRDHHLYKNWKVDDKDVWKYTLKDVLGYKQMNWKDVDFRNVVDFIAAARNSLVAPEESDDFLVELYPEENYRQAYFLYSEEMIKKKMLTFDDMLYYGVRLIQDSYDVRSAVQARYQHVIIDEFQDSNYAQLQLGELVAAPEYNYMVVGDADQAIYSFRGALPEFMMEFQEKYDASLIDLGTNYRCAKKIQQHSVWCIEHNKKRLKKELLPSRQDKGEVHVNHAETVEDEAVVIAETIKTLRMDGLRYSSMYCLMRMNSQSRSLEEEFVRQEIPFVVLGGYSFYQRKEIADLMSYLRLIIRPSSISAGKRAINRPFRYVGKQALDQIAERTVDSFIDAAEALYVYNHKVAEFVSLVRQFTPGSNPRDTLQKIVDATSFVHFMLQEEGSDSVESSRAANVAELISAASRFERIDEFVDYVDKQIRLRKRSNRKKDENKVQVMTIHKAKGDQAHTVFLIGTNDDILPHAKAVLEEERRLFYVAMTRAENQLYLSTVQRTNMNSLDVSRPSRFLYESRILE